MADIQFDRVKKIYDGGVVALEEFSLLIPSPTLVVLVGPSGCGKTTLLRLIAGLERPTSGTITLGGERLDSVEPRHRDVAMVFQNYALYPHMTVRDNLSFGLRIRKVSKETVVQSIGDVAKSLDIAHLLDRKPGELSGGQRQRVALGRAIVREPKVFLFDEPLSNLDARLRDDMRYMIKKLYRRLRTTMVYVTHDQIEAMTIGELLVVLKDGLMHQVGSPLECYSKPEDSFVASFLGSPPMNLLEGTFDASGRAVALANGSRLALTPRWAERLEAAGVGSVTVGVRPEAFEASDVSRVASEASTERGASAARQAGEAPRPMTLEGRIVATETLGYDMLAHVDIGGREIVVKSGADRVTAWGERIALHITEGSIHFFSGGDGKRIAWTS